VAIINVRLIRWVQQPPVVSNDGGVHATAGLRLVIKQLVDHAVAGNKQPAPSWNTAQRTNGAVVLYEPMGCGARNWQTPPQVVLELG